MRQLVYNAVKCHECEETIVSYSVHDYKTCGCDNRAMVDGGLDYARYGAMNMDKITSINIYADDDFEIVRQHATRGSRGKNNSLKLSYVKLCDMEDDHLVKVLEYGGSAWHLDLIKKEIDYRLSLLQKKLDK